MSNIVDYVERGNSVCDIKEWRLQWLKRCVSLLDILISEQIDNKIHINTQNAKRFPEAKFLTFDEVTNEQYKRYNKEQFYVIKAKHLLFNIMSNYIQYWWD